MKTIPIDPEISEKIKFLNDKKDILMSLFCYNLSHEEEAIQAFKDFHDKINELSFKYSLKNVNLYLNVNTLQGDEIENSVIMKLEEKEYLKYHDKFYRRNFYHNALKKTNTDKTFDYCSNSMKKIVYDDLIECDFIICDGKSPISISS